MCLGFIFLISHFQNKISQYFKLFIQYVKYNKHF